MAVTTSLSKAWEKKLLEYIYKTNGPVYVALFTTTPTRTGSGTECSSAEEKYKGYARVKLEETKWELIEAAGNAEGEEGYIKNKEKVEFPECTGGEAKVKGAALMTALSGGEVIVWGELTEEKTISTTNTPASYAAGTLKFKLN